MSSEEEPIAKRQKTDDPQETDKPDMTAAVPNEIMVKILLEVPLRDRIGLERVCHRWKDHLIPNSFSNVKNLEMGEFQGDLFYLLREPEISAAQKELKRIFKDVVNKIGGPKMESISFRDYSVANFCVDISELAVLRAKCPNLKKFAIGSLQVDITPAAAMRLGIELPTLESLEMLMYVDETKEDFAQECVDETHLAVAIASVPHLKNLAVEGGYSGVFLRYAPDSVVSLTIDHTYELKMSHLEEFLRSHPALKEFQLRISYNSTASQRGQFQDVVKLLAQHCVQLESLRIGDCWSETDAKNPSRQTVFADEFAKLTQLKQLHVDKLKSFNSAALESVCRNCPLLEDLSIHICRKRRGNQFGTDGFMEIWRLTKLKRLQLGNVPFTEAFATALFSGIGQTLERLVITHTTVTDASLYQIGLNCGSLAELNVEKFRSGHEDELTLEGLGKFIDVIVTHSSWTDPTQKRRLHIRFARQFSHLRGINLVKYGGKVKVEVDADPIVIQMFEDSSDSE